MKRRLLLAAALAVPSVAAPAIVRAQGTWPNKTVKFICPFAPGGGTDTVSRLMCDQLSKNLGQTFVVENKGGAGGNIGTVELSRATPDGYTIGLISVASHTLNPMLYSRLPYNPDKDIVAISRVAILANLLGVTPSLPANNVAELIALCKKDPGKYSFASSGPGTSLHLTGELLNLVAGIKMTSIPYKSSAQMTTDGLGGQIEVLIHNTPVLLPHIRANTIRAIGITSVARSPAQPEVPTVMEQGVKDFEITAWFGFMAPAGTPKAIVDQLSKNVATVLATPDVNKRISDTATEVIGSTPAFYAAFIKSETAKWKEVIIKAKMTPD